MFFSRQLFLFFLLFSAGWSAVPDLTGLKSQLVFYGRWSDSDIPTLQRYDLVVLQETHYDGADESTAIQTLRTSGTLVLLYISLGEDLSTYGGAPPRAGDGRGPAYYDANLGEVVYENRGIASYYLDHWNTEGFLSGDNANKVQDGLPDRHGTWGACVVNAGDTAWQNIVLTEVARLDALGIDGFFMDTPETPDPWQGYGWTAEGMYQLIRKLDESNPDRILLLNRGTFFFDPDNPYQYRWNPREFIDIALFESYFFDSNYPTEMGGNGSYSISPFRELNRWYTSPKFQAELAQKGKVIPVINIDYAADADNFPTAEPVLYQELLQDVSVKQGRLELLIDRLLVNIPTVILDNPPPTDNLAPQWQNSTVGKKSLFNPPPLFYDVVGTDYVGATDFDSFIDTARVGLQKSIPRDGAVTLRWDVATDQSRPVVYNVYWSDSWPLDVATANVLSDVAFVKGAEYTHRGYVSADDACPYEFTVTGLSNGLEHYFLVRAEDGSSGVSSPATGRTGPSGGIEDENTRVLAAVPMSSSVAFISIDGNTADWSALSSRQDPVGDVSGQDFTRLKIADDADSLYLYIETASSINGSSFSFFIDADGKSWTGSTVKGGADFKIQNGIVYEWTWDWNNIGSLGAFICDGLLACEMSLPKSVLGIASKSYVNIHVEESVSDDRMPDEAGARFAYAYTGAGFDNTAPVFESTALVAGNLDIDGAVLLEWSLASDAQSLVTYSILDGLGGSVVLNSKGDSLQGLITLSRAVTGLTNGQEYSFVILASDASGNSSESQSATATPTANTAPPVWTSTSGVVLASSGDGFAKLFFNAAEDASHPPPFYDLSYWPTDSPATKVVIPGMNYQSSSDSSYNFEALVTGLDNDREYNFQINARDRLGNSENNIEIATATPFATLLSVASMDGFFGDWIFDSSVESLGIDPSGDHPQAKGSQDILQAWAAWRNGKLFLRFEVADSIEILDWRYSIFLDTDNDPSTGYQGVFGIDRLIQGDGGVHSLATGTSWSPQKVGDATVALAATGGRFVELAVDSALLGTVSDGIQFFLQFGQWEVDQGFYDELGPVLFLLNGNPVELALREVQIESGMKIFFQGNELLITLPEKRLGGTLRVVDVGGRLLMSLRADRSDLSISTMRIPRGVFFIHYRDEQGEFFRKMLAK